MSIDPLRDLLRESSLAEENDPNTKFLASSEDQG